VTRLQVSLIRLSSGSTQFTRHLGAAKSGVMLMVTAKQVLSISALAPKPQFDALNGIQQAVMPNAC